MLTRSTTTLRLAHRRATANNLPSRVLLSTSASHHARLVEGYTSITPGDKHRPAPPPPVHSVPASSTARRPLPPIAPRDITLELKHDLEQFLVKALTQLHSAFSGGGEQADLRELARQMERKSGEVLQRRLEYESTPSAERKVVPGRVGDGVEGEQDGIVVVAHVLGGVKPKVSICSGFAVGTSERGEGATILTCAHTLQSISAHLENEAKLNPASTAPPSATFIISQSGHIYPVVSVLSSLPSSDILLLSLSPDPLRNPAWSLKHAGTVAATTSQYPSPPGSSSARDEYAVPRLRTLPISPYPSPVGTRVASLSYRHPNVPGAKGKPREWAFGVVTEYRDAIGRHAETGTYDDLSEVRFSGLPSAGSSGGPIIDVESGAVVGVIRGTQRGHGDLERRGFGTPAEKLFQLPNFVPNSAKVASKAAETKEDDESKRSE